MRALPRPARFYIWSVIALAMFCFTIALFHFPRTPEALSHYLIFSLLSVFAGLYPVRLPRGLIEITLSVAVNLAACILFTLPLVILISATGAFTTELHKRRTWYKALFNVSQSILTYTTASIVFGLLYGGQTLQLGRWESAIALVGAGSSYYLVGTTLVVAVVALVNQIPFWYIWQTHFRSITWHHLGMMCSGFILAILWRVEPWSIILIILPIAMLRQSIALTALLERQTHEAIEALIDTVDARDPSTYQHSERVAGYARAIAQKMGLKQSVIEQIAVSARLHDLGKVGIGDAWLYKKGPLTREERLQFEQHVTLGAHIVARLPVLGVEQMMVRHHHEWWDGRGYPDGLKEEEIPLGARIICVADAFDAMTSDRPYRQALSYSEARRRLKACAGTQFDPAVVKVALVVLPDGEKEGGEPVKAPVERVGDRPSRVNLLPTVVSTPKVTPRFREV